MNLTPDFTEIPQEIDNNKLPRYYLCNKVNEFQDSYLWSFLQENFKYTLREDIFDFMSFLSVNREIYNNVLNNFNKNENMKLSKKKYQYIEHLYVLYIIDSIIEDVEIINNKENIKDNKDGLKEEVTYENTIFIHIIYCIIVLTLIELLTSILFI